MNFLLTSFLRVLLLLLYSNKALRATTIPYTHFRGSNDDSIFLTTLKTIKNNENIFSSSYQSDLEPNIKNYDDNYERTDLLNGKSQALNMYGTTTEYLKLATIPENYQESVENNVHNIYTIHNFDENTIPRCPTGLTTYIGLDNKTICYKLTLPSEFPPSCPYPLNLDYYHFKEIHETELTDKIVWAYAQKNKYNDNFEWMYDIINSTVDKNSIYQNSINESDKRCLVVNGTKLMPVECSEKFYGICVYNNDFSLNDHNCKRKLNETCFSSNLGLLNKCYCINRNAQPRNSYCTKLADIEDPYQNYLLSKHFYKYEYCWFGLERSKWVSNTDGVKYSYWLGTNDFSKPYGAVGKHGWILENDKNLSCAVCEVNIENVNDVRLHLSRNFSNHRIQLEILNALDAFEGVLCLTGNDSYFINLSTSKENYILQDLWLFDDIKEYCWCKTLQLPHLQKIYSNKIIAISDKANQDVFVATWTFLVIDDQVNISTYSCPQVHSEMIINSKLIKSTFLNNERKAQLVCHYHTISNNLTRLEQYNILKQSLSFSNLTLQTFSNAKMCLPETTTSGGRTMHWSETGIGSTIVAKELCLQENGEPVTRMCGGNFTFGAEWLPVNGSCTNTSISPTTIFLNDLLYQQTLSYNISKELVRVTANKNDIDSFQIHLVSQLLEKVAEQVKNVSLKDIVSTMNNIMQIDVSKLKSSQETLNSTDTILWCLDEILIHQDDGVKEIGYINESSDKLLMQATSLIKSDIKGFKLQSSDAQVFDASKLEPLHKFTENEMLEENLDLVLLIPRDLHDNIIQCNGSKAKPTLITSMFFDDSLFNEYGITTGKPDGKILSVLIPGFNCSFSAPIKVIFKSSVNDTFEEKCASWIYGSNDLMESIHGRWAVEQEPKIFGNMSQYRLCEYSHVTHFALLVLGEKTNISSGHKKALDVITAIGSGLSILGLLGVFLTAALFKVYRATNGVVINFSISMAAQIILLFVADNIVDEVACTVFGALLHYIVLSQFFWMLTIAVLQYQRYVVIFSSPPNHLVAKACLFAWGVPLVPIIVIVAISTNNYGKNANGLCYVIGQYFTFGVLLPISLIILVNVMIFLRIMISVAGSRKIKVHRDNDIRSALQLRLAFMLFFLLGLTWGFGLLASIGGSVVYSYLFCVTATLQGFILFLFFIVLHEKTRTLWVNMKTCCSKYDEYDVNRDSASSVMMRKNKTTSTDTCTDSATSQIMRKLKNRSSSEF